MRVFKFLPLLLIVLGAPVYAVEADLVTSWAAVAKDDAGAALASPVTEYRLYECGEASPIATVAGNVLTFTEQGVITGTGSYCREVTAFVPPFEGARAQGVVVLVVPGQSTNVTVQARP